MSKAKLPVEIKIIHSGKFRRYAHLNFWQHLTVKGLASSNAKDVFKVGRGILQSIRLLRRFKPDVVFCKGGYVCLPIGYAARVLRIPLVIHDSDTRAGITNRILSRWATKIATGSPLENYSYPERKTVYTGVPVAPVFRPYSADDQAAAKQKLGFATDKPLVVVTGGGLGAASINKAMASAADELLKAGIAVYHITGKNHFDEVKKVVPKDGNYRLVPFVYENMDSILGAADIIVARGGATFLQEMAAMAKAVIIIPARHLSDQIKNAKVFDQAKAAIVSTDDEIAEPGRLGHLIVKLAKNEKEREQISNNLHSFAKVDAAKQLADIILQLTR